MSEKMKKQQTLMGKKIEDKNPNDDVFTPEPIAEKIVKMFQPTGRILEPCKGKGAFMKYLPNGTEWCEITEGRDFFDYKEKVDWLVTNPPYSIFNKFLEHSFEIADNVVFLTPVAKVLKSWGTIMKIKQYGGIKKIWFVPANRCGFPFGFPCGAFHFQRNYKGSMEVDYDEE